MEDYFEKGFLLVIADLLSLLTISSCLVCKIPQIKTINALKSAKGTEFIQPCDVGNWLLSFLGISLLGLLLELGSYTTTMSYNFVRGYSYLSYLEYPILLVQEYVLIYCVLNYSNLLNSKAYLWAGIYVAITSLFLTQILPPTILTMMLVSYRACDGEFKFNTHDFLSSRSH